MKKLNLLAIIPGILNTGLSLIRDKSKAKTEDGKELVNTAGANGVSISSKRVLNIAGTSSIIGIALIDIQTNGITKLNLALLAIGAAFSLAMSFITAKAE